MRVREDGSIQPSSTPTQQNVGRENDYALYRCVVTRVLYVDDPNNVTANASNPRVLYDVVVLGGFKSGQVLSNCRLSSDLGGESSYWERTLRACSKEISRSKLSEADGDIVLVEFVQGHTGFPMIVALDNGIHTADLIGAKQVEGPRSLREYNGVRETINSSGEWIQEIKGGTPRPEKGAFEAAERVLVRTSVLKTEKVVREFKSGLVVTEDGPADKITHAFSNGLSVVEDGTNDIVKIVTKNGLTITYDGANDDLKLKTKDGAELHLLGDKVALGSGSVEILDKLSRVADLVSQWATNVDAVHTHLGNLGYPTTQPDNFAATLQLGTDLATEKAEVDSIKGTL